MENAKIAELVYFRVIRKNKKVIHIDDEPAFSNHVLEGVIHESLEGGRGVAKPKEHDGWFKKFFVHNEGSFPLISFFDADIIIWRPDVHFSEDRLLAPFSLLTRSDIRIRYQGKGIGILDGMLVQATIVLIGVKRAIFLSHREECQGCLR